jgi:acyl-coenzyme A synthetase/AMP-(fatty) acid ligase
MILDLPDATAQWRTTFATTSAQRIALFFDDRLAFTAALFAAWAEGKQVVLPGDVLPATLMALGPYVDAFAGDFPNTPTLQPRTPTDAPFPELDRELLGVVVFTSGSTGAPTAIPKRLRQLFDEVATLEKTFGPRLGPGSTFFSTVSHQHIYGLLFSVLWPVFTHRKLTARRLEYPEQLEQVLVPAPCVLISSPAHLKRLPDVPMWKTQLKVVFSSGGPLPPEGAAMSRAVLGHQPIEIYGSSETGGIAWREGLDNPWTPMFGVHIRTSANDQLELQSPHLPNADWFTTADRIATSGDTFTLRGRADRIAKIEEKRVSLELIERTALDTGLVSEARVVTLQGARITLGLVGVLTEAGKALTRKQLVDRLKAALTAAIELVALPRRYRFVDAMPLNDQGKLTDARLTPLFAADRPEPVWGDRTATHASLDFTITPTLRVLDGHFPGTPVVPGVAQLDWAIGWGREAFQIKGQLARMDAIKYQRLLLPGHEVHAELDWNPEKAQLTFKFTSPKGVYSSGKVVLSA